MPREFTARSKFIFIIVAAATSGCDVLPIPGSPPPVAPRKIVIVVEENHGASQVLGNLDAPYMNSLVARGALFTNSFAITHPSEPNYIALFSGCMQGVVDDDAYPHEQFTAPNLGAKLLAAGLTFAGYSDGLPEAGSDAVRAGNETDGFYYRKHNPWVNWQDATVPLPPNKLPPSINLPFTVFPRDVEQLPAVSFVVPNQKHDMHDGSVAEADAWLERNLGPFVDWAATHDGLLILTWDEDSGLELNRIPTIFVGQRIQPGRCNIPINHYSVLRTIEDMHGLPHDGWTVVVPRVPDSIWK